jgi:hypothetical protein
MINSWGHSQHIVKWVGNLEKNEIKNYVTGFRVVRPQKKFKSVSTFLEEISYAKK